MHLRWHHNLAIDNAPERNMATQRINEVAELVGVRGAWRVRVRGTLLSGKFARKADALRVARKARHFAG